MAIRERPLSPHLQVYRWQIQMVTSILHRATGVALAVGTLAVAAGIIALASGPQAWQSFGVHAGAWYGKLLLFGWTWSLAYHLLNGIRHLIQDAGYGYSIPAFVRSGWLASIGSLALTALVWYCARGGLA